LIFEVFLLKSPISAEENKKFPKNCYQ